MINTSISCGALPDGNISHLALCPPLQDRRELHDSTTKMMHELASDSESTSLHEQSSIIIIGFLAALNSKLSKIFLNRGWAVLPEGNATRSLEYLAKNEFEKVLVDLDHVDIHAPQLIGEIRKTAVFGRKVEITGLSRFVVPGFERQLHRAGIDNILYAPF